MKTYNSVFAGMFLMVLSGAALAANGPGLYIGAGFGVTSGSGDKAGAQGVSEAFGATVTSVTANESDTTLRFLAGINFNENFSLEFNAADLGKYDMTVRDGVSTFTTDRYTASVDGYGLAFVINAPFTPKFSGLVKLGVFSWSSDVAATIDLGGGRFVSAKVSETGSDPMIGIGGIYRVSKNFGLRGEFEHFAIKKADAGIGDINTLTMNGILYF